MNREFNNNIDWDLTYEKFSVDIGTINLANKKVVYKCPRCFKITTPLHKKIKNRKYAECLSCINILHPQSHGDKIKKLWKDKNYQNKVLPKLLEINVKYKDKMMEIYKSDKYKLKKSIESKQNWGTAEYVKKIAESFTTERRLVMSEKAILLHKNIKYRNKFLSSFTVERRKKTSETIKKTMNSLEYKLKMRPFWDSFVFRDKMAKINHSHSFTSLQQNILYSILDDLHIKYYNDKAEETLFKICKTDDGEIHNYSVDCIIPKQSSINLEKDLIIEVNGDWIHNLPKVKAKDKSKATFINRYFPQYNLRYLWEHEFNNKDRIINLLKYWLGFDNTQIQKFDFKNINEKIIDSKQAEIFISKYHYAMRLGRSGVNLGYFIGDELIASIIYVYPTRQETAQKQGFLYKEVLELSRLAIHPNYQVKNLASHIISRSINFIKNNVQKIKCLVSFADATYNHTGTIYKASNWTLDGPVQPNYWYVDSEGFVCHKKTMWDHAVRMKMTEDQYCEKYGYKRIYGLGKQRFVYIIKNNNEILDGESRASSDFYLQVS